MAGTWMPNMQAAYQLHEIGIAHSIKSMKAIAHRQALRHLLGHMFFGESMFSLCSNASKVAFITQQDLRGAGVNLIIPGR